MANAQEILLKPPTSLPHPRPQIIALGRRKATVTQERGGDADMPGVGICQRRGGAVVEKMRIDALAEGGESSLGDAVVDSLLSQWRAV